MIKKIIESLPWYLIILFCALTGIAIAAFLERAYLFPSSEPPFRLPSQPTKAEILIGINSSGFFDTTPWIKTAGGIAYLSLDDTWQLDTPPNSFMSEPCQREVQELIEDLGGTVISCMTVQPYGEWCAAPTTSFAISKDGNVWKYEKELPCTIGFSFLLPIFCVAGLVFGIVTLIIRQYYEQLSRKNQPNNKRDKAEKGNSFSQLSNVDT